MIATPLKALKGIMCQHDLQGNRLFQHRNSHKWKAFAPNKRVKGFLYEKLCLEFLHELRKKWDGTVHPKTSLASTEGLFTMRAGTCDHWVYWSVVERNEYQLPKKFGHRDVIIDVGAHIGSFSFACLRRGAKRVLAFEPERQNFQIARHNLRQFGKRVRLFQKAVWRSDRPPGILLHSGYIEGESQVNTGGGTVLPTVEANLQTRNKEAVNTVSLDKVLRRFKRIGLLKLDCEGSEWPILLTSKEMHKVEKICGEFHEFRQIPSPALVEGHTQYTREELKRFLKKHYRKVRIGGNRDGELGLFWAEDRITPGTLP
jgi:FkbM family methyltransferase